MDLSLSRIDCLSRSSALCSCSLRCWRFSIFISKSFDRTNTRRYLSRFVLLYALFFSLLAVRIQSVYGILAVHLILQSRLRRSQPWLMASRGPSATFGARRRHLQLLQIVLMGVCLFIILLYLYALINLPSSVNATEDWHWGIHKRCTVRAQFNRASLSVRSVRSSGGIMFYLCYFFVYFLLAFRSQNQRMVHTEWTWRYIYGECRNSSHIAVYVLVI